MATGGYRDEAALTEGLSRWLVAHGDLVPGALVGGPALRITALAHATAGMANETVLVDLAPDHEGIVLRLPPILPTFDTYDLSIQAQVQNVVAAAGIPAPAPAVVVDDPRWLGAPFLVMPRIEGYIPGPAPLFDEQITGAPPALQRALPYGLIDTLAALHAVDWTVGGLQTVLTGPTLADALAFWSAYVEWAGAGAPLPALATALDWCRSHQPAPASASAGADAGGGVAPALLWGDARLGNLVFDEDRRVRAVLDWDLASLGPPEMDLGWYFGLDFMMEQLFGGRVPGFPHKSEAVARYEERSGRTVRDLDWHEVFALVRALAINDRHQRIAAGRRGARGDRGPARPRENPMVQILLDRIDAAG